MLISRQTQRGVTIVEIAVTLVVTAILLFAVMPDTTLMIGNSRIRSVADSAQAGLQRARVEAMRRNQPVTFWMVNNVSSACTQSATGASWIVSRNDPASSCDTAISETSDPMIFDRHDGQETAAVVSVAGTAADHTTAAQSISFDGLGRVSGGSLRLIDVGASAAANNFRALRIEVTNGGVVRLCEPKLTAISGDARRCLYSAPTP